MKKHKLPKKHRKSLEQLINRNLKARKEYRRETQRLKTSCPGYVRIFSMFQRRALLECNISSEDFA